MNLQHERIDALCQQLKLERVATHYPVLAQQAVREDFSFTDFRNTCCGMKRVSPAAQPRTADADGLLPGHQDPGGL
ncbi:Putative transposase (identified by ISEscan HMM) [Escherichia coli]|nr:Putative transposase (identified by ISEscan HMM) [Escherichia coli]